MSHKPFDIPDDLASAFVLLGSNDVRIAGHRHGIEDVLLAYLDEMVPEEIAIWYPTLTLDEIRRTIDLYERDPVGVGAYVQAAREHEERARAEQRQNPSPAVKRLSGILAQRRSASSESRRPA